MIPNEKMLAVKEAAYILGVSRDTVIRMIRNGSLKAFKLPKCGGKGRNVTFRISESALHRLIG